MADNTVETKLRSTYEDGIAAGIEQTQQAIERAFGSIEGGLGSFSNGFSSAFGSAQNTLSSWRTNLSKTADESESHFHRMSLATIAFGIGIAETFLFAGRAVFNFFKNAVDDASKAFAVKMSFENLAGESASKLSSDLKRATDGQVSGTQLLTNAVKILSSQLPITSEQYVLLTSNVARLAKATGGDAVEANNALTEALLRGNPRMLVHYGVLNQMRDATKEASAETGELASEFGTMEQKQAMINHLLEQTNAQVKLLPENFKTLEEITTQANNTFKSVVGSIGVGILRSGVFQGLLEQASESMFGLSVSTSQQRDIALKVNEALIYLLQSLASMARFVGIVSLGWDLLKGSMVAVGNAIGVVMLSAVTLVSGALWGLYALLGLLPGNTGKAFKGTADQIGAFTKSIAKGTAEVYEASAHAFDGVGAGNEKLQRFADGTIRLSEEMSKLSGKVLGGAGDMHELADAAQKSTGDFKLLQEQMRKYYALIDEIHARTATPDQKAFATLQADLRKAEELTIISEKLKNTAKADAFASYFATLKSNQAKVDAEIDAAWAANNKKLQEEQIKAVESSPAALKQIEMQVWLDGELLKIDQEAAKKKEEERKKEVSQVIAAASTIQQALKLAEEGKISQSAGLNALGNLPKVIDQIKAKIKELESLKIISDEQMNEVVKLKEKLDELNKMKFTPFESAMKTMKNDAKSFGSEAGAAFTQFFKTVASGQQGAATALLASFGSMIGSMISKMGQTLFSAGITEMLLAATVVGRAAGANEASGAIAMAEGIALMAAGGAVSGLTSAASSSSAKSSSSTSSSSSTAPTTNQVLTLGGQTATQSQDHTVTVKLDAIPGYASKQLNKEFRLNPSLRLRLQNG